jgi:hypothetical protein
MHYYLRLLPERLLGLAAGRVPVSISFLVNIDTMSVSSDRVPFHIENDGFLRLFSVEMDI